MRFVDRTFVLWVGVGLAVPFLLGWLLGGTLAAGLTGLLWGGAVRMLVVHHVTYSINSLCHFFGRQPFATADESRNLAWLAPFTFGEAWHNNHHAFPTSARHGLRRGRSTSPPRSSGCSSASGSPGTSCASRPSASRRALAADDRGRGAAATVPGRCRSARSCSPRSRSRP